MFLVKKHSEEGNLRLLPLDTAVVSQSAIKVRQYSFALTNVVS